MARRGGGFFDFLFSFYINGEKTEMSAQQPFSDIFDFVIPLKIIVESRNVHRLLELPLSDVIKFKRKRFNTKQNRHRQLMGAVFFFYCHAVASITFSIIHLAVASF